MAALAHSDSILSDQVVGTYDCRRSIWERIKKLGVRNDILTKQGAQLVKLFYDECLEEQDFEGFLDAAARLWHHSLKFASRRQKAEDLISICQKRLDDRARLWLDDQRSWESLALCPIAWDRIVALRRNGIHSVATLQMLDDKELSKIDGIGPARIKLIRCFCRRVLREQHQANPLLRPVRRRKTSLASIEPALF